MRKLLCLTVLSLASLAPAFAQRELPPIAVGFDARSIRVHVSANTPALNSLAYQAFRSHGRYNPVASDYKYDFKFSLIAPHQVRVDILKGSETLASQVAVGTSDRNALLRAADIAVEKTNGLGLKGYFASKLTFLIEAGSHKEVCVGDLFFGDVIQVTHDNAIAMTPRWTPDGNRIVYTSFYQTGFPDIFMIDLASNQRSTFESFKGTNSGARFSPDGRHVAMVLTGSGNTEIWVADASGHGLQRRTRSDLVKSSPAWSPDGSQLIFASEPGPQLYTMSAYGGSPHRVTHDISSYCAEPDWSRAAPTKVAFTMRLGRAYQIAVLDLSTGQSKQVSQAPFDGIEPCWLPDGRHLVFTARNASRSGIFILDTETGRGTPVSPSSLPSVLEANVLAR